MLGGSQTGNSQSYTGKLQAAAGMECGSDRFIVCLRTDEGVCGFAHEQDSNRIQQRPRNRTTESRVLLPL